MRYGNRLKKEKNRENEKIFLLLAGKCYIIAKRKVIVRKEEYLMTKAELVAQVAEKPT